MCDTSDGLIENLYYMNTGTAKHSARFYHAQINGGWTCEKRFMEYASQIGLNTLPGFMMFTRTAQAFQNGDEMQYVCLFFHDDSNALVNIAQELLQVPFFREVYCVNYSADATNWRPLIGYQYGPNGSTTICKPDYSFERYDGTAGSFVAEREVDFLQNFEPKTPRVGRAIRSNIADYQRYFSWLRYDQLQELYAERFFIQVLLKGHRAPMQDFDAFIENGNQWDIVEIKQKDAAIQNGQERFGWDAHRLALYLYIIHHTSFGGCYVISEIDNRTQRNHLQWLSISIEEMLQNLSWGDNRNGTLMLPKNSFDII
jgi:hypothetical protein